MDPRQIASKKAPRGPGGVFSTKPRPPKVNMPSANTVLVPISGEARPFAPSSRPKQKYPQGGFLGGIAPPSGAHKKAGVRIRRPSPAPSSS